MFQHDPNFLAGMLKAFSEMRWPGLKQGKHRLATHGTKARGENPAGTKLVKRFIKRASGENLTYRKTLDQMVPGHPLGYEAYKGEHK